MIKDLEFLTQFYPIDQVTSRKFSLLLFLYLQGALIASSALLLSHSWRTGDLYKNRVNANALRILHTDVVMKPFEKKSEMLLDRLSGIPDLPQLLIQGEFGLVINLSWSIIERILDLFSKRENPTEQAKSIGFYSENFKACRDCRNIMAHEGYKPKYEEALTSLILIRSLLEFLLSCNLENHASNMANIS